MQPIALGHDHSYVFVWWTGKAEELPADHQHLLDERRAGLLVYHRGARCSQRCYFKSPMSDRVMPHTLTYAVSQWEPLTVDTEIVCRRCGDAGYIRAGVWVPSNMVPEASG